MVYAPTSGVWDLDKGETWYTSVFWAENTAEERTWTSLPAGLRRQTRIYPSGLQRVNTLYYPCSEDIGVMPRGSKQT
jgi:hypothetical protein